MATERTPSAGLTTLVFGCDHAGWKLKQALMEHVKTNWPSIAVSDVGCFEPTRCDYPDSARLLCDRIVDSKATAELRPVRGVLVCGSGIGISIAANRRRGIRCALVHDTLTARMSRNHNDSNVIAFGERTTGEDTAKDALDAWICAGFDGGRHSGRVDKIEENACGVQCDQ